MNAARAKLEPLALLASSSDTARLNYKSMLGRYSDDEFNQLRKDMDKLARGASSAGAGGGGSSSSSSSASASGQRSDMTEL